MAPPPGDPRIIRDYRYRPLESLKNREEIIAKEEATAVGRVVSTNKGEVIPPYYPRAHLISIVEKIITSAQNVGVKSFREFDIVTNVAVGDVFDVTTGGFAVAGLQATFSSFGVVNLSASGANFRDDIRIKFFHNGVLQSKGATVVDARDVYWLSPTTVAFGSKLKSGDILTLETLGSFY